jgi:hypothetical protein
MHRELHFTRRGVLHLEAAPAVERRGGIHGAQHRQDIGSSVHAETPLKVCAARYVLTSRGAVVSATTSALQ